MKQRSGFSSRRLRCRKASEGLCDFQGLQTRWRQRGLGCSSALGSIPNAFRCAPTVCCRSDFGNYGSQGAPPGAGRGERSVAGRGRRCVSGRYDQRWAERGCPERPCCCPGRRRHPRLSAAPTPCFARCASAPRSPLDRSGWMRFWAAERRTWKITTSGWDAMSCLR